MPRNAEAAAEPLNDDLRLMFQQIGQGMSALAQNVTALAQQNNTILQALGPDLANISQAVQNPAALEIHGNVGAGEKRTKAPLPTRDEQVGDLLKGEASPGFFTTPAHPLFAAFL